MIYLKDIKKVYRLGSSTVNALDGISLEICEGDFIAIVGPSGSGKSTLMNIIGCLDTADSGEYVINGTPVSHYKDKDLATLRNKHIGFVFQQFNLLSHLTALENVELPLIYSGMPKTKRRQIARRLLEDVGLSERLKHKPTELSGGQQQRVSIARALSNSPDIILADEPTGALDSKSGTEIMTLLTRLNSEGKTIILVTHDMNIASYAKRIITLMDGKIIKDTISEKEVKDA